MLHDFILDYVYVVVSYYFSTPHALGLVGRGLDFVLARGLANVLQVHISSATLSNKWLGLFRVSVNETLILLVVSVGWNDRQVHLHGPEG